MTIQYKTFQAESKAIDIEAGIFEAMISTEGVDRDQDILVATGCDTSAFNRNAVVLWSHQYSELPVAKALETQIIAGVGIRSRFQFPEWGAYPKADIVRRLWAGGFINACSVGFIPKKWEKRETNDGELLASGYKITTWELLEYSLVGVPANAGALRLSIEEGDDFEDLLTKRGRVLSAANEKRIREAVTNLQGVLESLGEEEDDGKYVDETGQTVTVSVKDAGTTEITVLSDQAEPNTDDPSHDASEPEQDDFEAIAGGLSNFLNTIKELIK